MSRTDAVSLRDRLTPEIAEQQSPEAEDDVSHFGQADSRQWESHRKRASVLLGSAILQLPIWGNPKSLLY